MLSGVPDVAFKVKNFTAANMSRLDEMWDEIAGALRLAVGLLSDFGLSGGMLTASSIVIPLAQYVHHRGLDQPYREVASAAQDRAALKNWVMRALIVPGVWGSGWISCSILFAPRSRRTATTSSPSPRSTR